MGFEVQSVSPPNLQFWCALQWSTDDYRWFDLPDVEISWESHVEFHKQYLLCLSLFADDVPIEDIIFEYIWIIFEFWYIFIYCRRFLTINGHMQIPRTSFVPPDLAYFIVMGINNPMWTLYVEMSEYMADSISG